MTHTLYVIEPKNIKPKCKNGIRHLQDLNLRSRMKQMSDVM